MIIDPIFNKFKTKFQVLDQLSFIESTNKKSKIVVYISIEMILKNLYVQQVERELSEENDDNKVRITLISNMINLAQHYRWYFVKKGYDCDVYLYWNYPIGPYKNLAFNKEYRSYYNNKMYNSTNCIYLMKQMEKIVKMLKMIFDRMNGIHLIMSNEIESSLIPYIIYKDYYNSSNQIRNILVSNDKYDLQYTKYNFGIILPRQEDTIYINKDNVYKHLKTNFRVKSELTLDTVNQISLVLSVLGCKYRSISKINGIGILTIMKMIRTAIDQILITDNSSSLKEFYPIIKDQFKNQVEINFRCVDIDSQYLDLTMVDIHQILSQISDKFDENAIIYLNDRYFQDCPILTFGNTREQILNNKGIKNIFDR